MKQAPEWAEVAANGSFALAQLVAAARNNPDQVFLGLVRKPKYVEEFRKYRAIPKRFFTGLPAGEREFPENVFIYSNNLYKQEYGELVIPERFICSYPVQKTREALTTLLEIHPNALNHCNIAVGSKALEAETEMRPCEMVEEVLGHRKQIERVCFMMGGNLAVDLFAGAPMGAGIAGGRDAVRSFCKLYEGSNLMLAPYGPELRVALEEAAIAKNVHALAAGVADGMGMRPSTISTLGEACFSESSRLVAKIHPQVNEVLLNGPLNDYSLSVISGETRNYKAGKRLGEYWIEHGRVLSQQELMEKKVIEGVLSAAPLLRMGQKYKVKMPIVETLVGLLDGEINPDQAQEKLINELREWYLIKRRKLMKAYLGRKVD